MRIPLFGLLLLPGLLHAQVIDLTWPNQPCATVLNCDTGCTACNLPAAQGAALLVNAPVVAGPDLLFGVTASGGTNGNGVIYSVVPSTDAVQTRYIFPPLVGGALMGNLLAGDDGLLYGLASFGGTNFQGLFYRFDPATNTVTGLHSFLSALDGATPRGDLVAAGTITGVREAMTEGSFELWPSPSRGVLHIDLGVNWRSGTRVRISDALGATVYEASLVAPRNTLQVDAAPGAYTVSVITAERTSVRRWLLER